VLDETLSALRVRRYVAHSTPYFSVAPSILKQGRAVATLSAYVARELALVHGLACLEPPFDFGKFDIHVVWHRKDKKETGHRWLRGRVSEHLTGVLGKAGRCLEAVKHGRQLLAVKHRPSDRCS